MLNRDLDRVIDLCEEQFAVRRAKQALPKDQRAQLENEKGHDPADIAKIGVTAIVVTPDGNGWKFEGQANFQGAVHPRTHEGPSRPPSIN